MAVPEKLTEPYDPQETEGRIYTLWEESGFFNPDICIREGITREDAEHFSMVLPPPNVTGTLHLGHAYENSLQDVLVRFARMRGKKALWIPGTDSAAIATQARVEKNIQKDEGKSRHDVGREELVRRVHEFAKNSESTILNQVRTMGASLDWSRYAYTLDEARNLAVFTAFKRMYDAGLIYRGHRIVNWDPKGQTTISDDEVLYTEEKTSFYYFQYGPFVIGTARPETKFGDKYVVIHPDDERYKEYQHGQKIELEWINGPITATVIKDTASDPEMGSGVMTITPWHSMADFEIAERHTLDKEQIIDRYGKLLPIAGEFAGMSIATAREKIVEKLKRKGLAVKIEENYVHNIATAERTGAIIEPQIMEQWFVAVNKPFTIKHSKLSGVTTGSILTLRELMRIAVESGAVSMPQEGFRRTYFHWIDNLRDWCISRQIWFGHRIPAWYDVENPKNRHGKIYFAPNTVQWDSLKSGSNSPGRWLEFSAVDELLQKTRYTWTEIKNNIQDVQINHCEAPEVSINQPSEGKYLQDPDVLDTWFSSALWTFSTLGWPREDSSDLKRFHPTSFMSPAYEILNLWVSRMILMSGFHLGEAPFRAVLIHGLVRDREGRKFSKSLGNGIDPLEMIERYGADALRMGLVVGTAIGNDLTFDENKIRGYKHFANKLWNISRFVLSRTEGIAPDKKPALAAVDQKYLEALHEMTREVTDDFEKYRLYLAAEKLYHYVWHTFADVIIEESKKRLEGADEAAKRSAAWTLNALLTEILILLHPLMPFVTEEIWSLLPSYPGKRLLMVTAWPIKK